MFLSGKKSKNVSVIGGGIVGLATALMLKESGHSVKIFEQNTSSGLGTSFANGGLFSTGSVPLINRNLVIQTIKNLLMFQNTSIKFNKQEMWKNKKELYRWTKQALRNYEAQFSSEKLTALTLDNLRILEKLMNKYNFEFEARKEGTLYIYDTKESLDDSLSILEKKFHLGLDIKFLTRQECIQLEKNLGSIDFYGGILSVKDWSGDSYLLCQEIERVLTSQDVEVNYNSTVKNITKKKIQLENGEEIHSDQIVLCTGACVNLLKNHVPKNDPMEIIPIKGYSLTFEIHEKDIHLLPKLPIFNAKERVVVTPFRNRIRISGVAEFSGLNSTITNEQERKLINHIEDIFPTIKKMKILNTTRWCGFRALSSTGICFTKRVNDSMVVNIGHAHLGTSLAFSTAKAVCEII
eukprot:gene11533-4786_t